MWPRPHNPIESELGAHVLCSVHVWKTGLGCRSNQDFRRARSNTGLLNNLPALVEPMQAVGHRSNTGSLWPSCCSAGDPFQEGQAGKLLSHSLWHFMLFWRERELWSSASPRRVKRWPRRGRLQIHLSLVSRFDVCQLLMDETVVQRKKASGSEHHCR